MFRGAETTLAQSNQITAPWSFVAQHQPQLAPTAGPWDVRARTVRSMTNLLSWPLKNGLEDRASCPSFPLSLSLCQCPGKGSWVACDITQQWYAKTTVVCSTVQNIYSQSLQCCLPPNMDSSSLSGSLPSVEVPHLILWSLTLVGSWQEGSWHRTKRPVVSPSAPD